MIILLGPDHSGKTTLAHQLTELGNSIPASSANPSSPKLEYVSWAADQHTEYLPYLDLLSGHRTQPRDPSTFTPGDALNRSKHIIADRFFYCEGPYSEVYRRSPQRWTLKQLHNLHLLTLAHNPVIVLTTRKGPDYFGREQYVGEEYFEPILDSYRDYIALYGLEPWVLEWDYTKPPMTPRDLIELSLSRQSRVIWWRNLAKQGLGGVGNTVSPKVVVVAEEIGPNNTHNIPFETGPSGYYLTNLLDEAEIPLSSFYLTNYHRGGDAAQDNSLIATELSKLKPQSVILLGAESRKAIPTIQKTVPTATILTLNHPGWVVNHASSLKEKEARMRNYSHAWKIAWKEAMIPRKTTKSSKTTPGVAAPADLPSGSRGIELIIEE